MQEPIDENEEQTEEYYENLRLENEIKKIKLSLEHGTDLSSQLSDADLPPEVEGKFLDYIQQFEDEFAKRQTILVYDLGGKPDCRPVNEIADDEINAELTRILEILYKKSISITTLCDVPDRVLYKFITEELFVTETNDIRIPGMTHGFIYEEFHPNHEYDIRNRFKELVDYLFNKDKENATDLWEIADTVENGGQVYLKKELLEKLAHFRDAFSKFTVHDFTDNFIRLNEACDLAEVSCTIHYTGEIDGSIETMDFEGECRFSLKRESDWWTIHSFEIPGVVL